MRNSDVVMAEGKDKLNIRLHVYDTEMINIALNLEFEKTNNDTAPYDDILTKITNEIEDALGVSETGMRAATDKK